MVKDWPPSRTPTAPIIQIGLDTPATSPAIFGAVSEAASGFDGYRVGQELIARYSGHPLFDMATPSPDDTFVTVYLRSADPELEADLRLHWTPDHVRIEIVDERDGWYAHDLP